MKIFICVPQSIVNHAIHDFLIAEPVARPSIRQKIRAVGHGLHATRDDNLRFTGLYRLRRQRNRLQPGTADLINGHGRDARVAATLQRCLPRRILAKSGLHHVAENRFVNLLRVNARAPRRFRHDLAAKLRRGKSSQATLEFSNGRARGRQNDGVFHTCLRRGEALL